MEQFDVLDCTGGKTGDVVARDEAHRGGVWHGSFHCLIVYSRDDKAYALFQKRAAGKKIAPGKFDISVGGHYAAGEDARTAGPREIGEELGLDVRFEELLPLGRRVFVYCFTPGVKEYEFQDVFLLPKQVRPGELNLQQEEVDGVLEMDVEAGLRLFSGERAVIEIDLYGPVNTPVRTPVSVQDFVPCLDNYYLKLLIIAQRYFKGERSLLFV